jgi:hypothetical protein
MRNGYAVDVQPYLISAPSSICTLHRMPARHRILKGAPNTVPSEQDTNREDEKVKANMCCCGHREMFMEVRTLLPRENSIYTVFRQDEGSEDCCGPASGHEKGKRLDQKRELGNHHCSGRCLPPLPASVRPTECNRARDAALSCPIDRGLVCPNHASV